MSVGTDPLLGTDLAGYRIEAVLGRGGMGVVYLATDLRLERKVALKLVAPELAGDPRFRERFLRESRLAASLDHSHVVPVYAAGELDGQLWIAMRYVQGTDLRTLLDAEGPLEPARSVELCSQIGEALDAAHAHGLVHRDVKPANVLVTEEGGEEHGYLADFGLARTADLDAVPGTGAHLSGTVDYTAPEQIAAEQADSRADVYSLACVLYECLAGEPPFKRPRAVATLFAHASEPPPSLHEERPDLPEPIDQVIGKALAKDPGERYETCRDLTEAARQALGLGTPRFTRRQLVLAGTGAALAIAAAAAVPAILLTRRDGGAAPESILPLAGDSVVRIDPDTGEVTAAVPFNGAGLISVGEGYIWTTSTAHPVLAQIDPATDAVLRTVDTSELGVPEFFAAGEGSVWLGRPSLFAARLWRYDLRSATLAPVPAEAHGVATGEGAVWAYVGPSQLVRIDPATGTTLSTTDLREAGACECFTGGIAAGERSVWLVAGGEAADTVFRLDLDTNELVTIPIGAPTGDIAVGDRAVWATNFTDDTIVRIDPGTDTIIGTVRVGRIPTSIAVGNGSVWVASQRDGTIIRVDPTTTDLQTIDVGGTATDLAVGEGAVWVTVNVR
jgi:streptogramin lyase